MNLECAERSVTQRLGGTDLTLVRFSVLSLSHAGRKGFRDHEVLIRNQQKLHSLPGRDKGTEGFSLKTGEGDLLLIVLCSNCLISPVSLGLHAADFA